MTGPLAGPFPGVSKIGDRLGGSLPLGAVQLLNKDPGLGWLAEDASIPYSSKLDGVLPFNIDLAGGWTRRSNPWSSSNATCEAVEYGNGLWVAGAGGKIATSPDGVTWTDRTPSGMGGNVDAIRYGGGVWVIIVAGNVAYRSTDGITFALVGTIGTPTMVDLAYGNGRFIAVSVGNAFISTDGGLSWTQSLYSGFGGITCVTFGNGKFVAAGGTSGTSRFYTSVDGADWTLQTFSSSGNIAAVTFGKGIFFAVSNSFYFSASNPVAFIKGIENPFTASYFSVVYGAGRFFMADDSERILFSSDGLGFSLSPVRTNHDVRALAYGRGRLVAGASTGRLISTTTDPLMVGRKLEVKPDGKDDWKAYTRIAA